MVTPKRLRTVTVWLVGALEAITICRVPIQVEVPPPLIPLFRGPLPDYDGPFHWCPRTALHPLDACGAFPHRIHQAPTHPRLALPFAVGALDASRLPNLV